MVYGFLRTTPNAVVGPILLKAMPGNLDERRGTRCLNARAMDEAKALQQPLPEDVPKIATEGLELSSSEPGKKKSSRTAYLMQGGRCS